MVCKVEYVVGSGRKSLIKARSLTIFRIQFSLVRNSHWCINEHKVMKLLSYKSIGIRTKFVANKYKEMSTYGE
ncbi:unnamed protein product [Lactuca virosa]|uniref:Uncharacterized protein n=1 Tax=Lactuca virosa TaxID=75947 RepID=A0AAU9N4T8_9ASTR|nr:unnamed protein product [Lactuca virosa]